MTRISGLGRGGSWGVFVRVGHSLDRDGSGPRPN
jgi:hypothetical protein